MKALIDIPKEANQTLNILKAQMGFRNKSETIAYVVNKFKESEMEPELRPEYIEKIRKIQKEPRVSFKSVEDMNKFLDNV